MPVEKYPNADRPESLEAQLRALPPPPVPADLEARLLAAIPAELPAARRRGTGWVGFRRGAAWGVGAVAAACLLVVLLWPKRDRKEPIPEASGVASAPEASGVASAPRDPVAPAPGVRKEITQPPDQSLAVRLQAQRTLDETALPPFTWPVQEAATPVTIATTIPADLLD